MTDKPNENGGFTTNWGLKEWLAVQGLYTALLGTWNDGRTEQKLIRNEFNNLKTLVDAALSDQWTVTQHALFTDGLNQRQARLEKEIEMLKEFHNGRN